MQENVNAPVQLLNAAARRRILLVCDHASAHIPPEMGTLGLGPQDLSSHIAWDIGAAAVTQKLAERWQSTAVLAGVSRLVVDCNRAPGADGWMPPQSCGVTVPGNARLDGGQVQDRKRRWYDAYHQAVAAQIARLQAPAVVAIHSFTPNMAGQDRPWQVGVLWNRDDRLARAVLAGLRQIAGLVVGDNQPYSGQTLNYTLDHHADRAGLPHVSLELRQDLVADAPGIAHWSGLLDGVLGGILCQMGL